MQQKTNFDFILHLLFPYNYKQEFRSETDDRYRRIVFMNMELVKKRF